jgi:membrane protease YdiL (CAAX protease family)
MLASKTPYKFWRINSLGKGWKIGLVLLLIFSLLRFYLVIQANITGSYHFVSFIFMAMIILPFLMLSKHGRQEIGLKAKLRWRGLGISILIGVASSVIIYLAMLIFHSESQPYHYIAETYTNLPLPLGDQRFMFFIIFSGISMFFSPLGEEFFYRGIIHENFKVSFSEKTATIIDSGAFALVHLAHFGIILREEKWSFLFLPSVFWVLMLFLTCLGFNYCRKVAGSIWGAVIAHACFNLTMNFIIFYQILD